MITGYFILDIMLYLASGGLFSVGINIHLWNNEEELQDAGDIFRTVLAYPGMIVTFVLKTAWVIYKDWRNS